jgi:predicted acetyltransferase
MLDVRTITPEEVPGWVEAMADGFYEAFAPEEVERRRAGMALDRTWAALDGGRVVGTLRSFATPLTLPGGAQVPVAALTNVTVMPTHRRRGLLRRMMTADLQAAAARGECAGILIASEYPIYGRYGYGPATQSLLFEIDARGLAVRGPADGAVELVDATALRGLAPAVYERHRAVTPGAIARDDRWWDRALGLAPSGGTGPAPTAPHYRAVSRDGAGAVDGYVRYHVEQGRWEHFRP